MQFFNANESVIDVSLGSSSLPNYSSELTYLSAPSGEIHDSSNHYDGSYIYNPNDYSVAESVDASFVDYQSSSNSMVPNGYYFERGPVIYCVEAAGTTYYYQNAVPVFRYEESSYVDYQNSSNSIVPNSYHFERGQYIYTVEAGGTTYYYQNAVAFFSISGFPQSNSYYDVSRTLLSTSSNILENGNHDMSKSTVQNEMLKKSEESKSSVKSDAICYLEENEKVINLGEHKIHIISDETSKMESIEKGKKEDKKMKLKVKYSVKNQDCVRRGVVSESEKVLKLSSVKGDTFCNLEDNKKIKQKFKNGKAMAVKLVEKENSADKNEGCISELLEKDKKEHRKIKLKVKYSVKNQDCIRSRYVSQSEKVLKLSSVKGDKFCNFEDNVKIKQKLKNGNAIAVKLVEKENSADKDECCISELLEKVRKLDELESVVEKSCDGDNSVEPKIYKNSGGMCNLETNNKIKLEVKKRKVKDESSLKNHNSFRSTDLSKSEVIKNIETFEKLSEQRTSVKSNESCYLKVEGKKSSDFNEVGNSEENKKKKRKRKKRKSNVEESIEIKEYAKNDEICNVDLNKTFHKSEEQKTSVKSDERCDSKVNEKESSDFNKVSIPEKNKKRKRKNKKKKSKVKEHAVREECAKKDEICNVDLNKTFQKSEEEKTSVKSDERCDSKVNEKESSDFNKVNIPEKNKKKKRKNKKNKSKVKEHTVMEECAKNDEICNVDLNKTFQKSEEEKTSVKSDERCDSKVNEKESSDFNKVSIPEKNKKRKRKYKKNKSKVKEHAVMEECAKNKEICNFDLNEIFQKSEEQRTSVKSDGLCYSKVNGKGPTSVDHKRPLCETPDKKVCYEKKISESKNDVSLNFDEHHDIYTDSACFNEEFNQEKSKTSCSSSIEQFYLNNNPIFELLDPKSNSSDGNIEFKYFDQDITFKESVSSTKTEELPNRNSSVLAQQSNSHLDSTVRRNEIPCEDSSNSAASSEIKKKKKRFQKVRKWFTDLCCCMRKDNE